MVTVTLSNVDGFKLELLISASRGNEAISLRDTYLIEFLTVFLLFEFLPVPIDFDILLMRRDNFILDLVGSFFLAFILKSSAVSFSLIGFCFDRIDRTLSLSGKLLKITYTMITNVCETVLQGSGRW